MAGAFLTDDLASMLAVGDFATAVTFTPSVGSPVTFDAIFDNGNVEQSVGGLLIEATGPQLTLATSDVPAAYKAGTYTINGSNYTAVEHKPDGTGLSVISLHAA